MASSAHLIAPFFGLDTPGNVEETRRGYFAFWRPSVEDVAGATLAATPRSVSSLTLDDMACSERSLILPPMMSRAVDSGYVGGSGCTVYIGDGEYAMRKVAIVLRCGIDARSPGRHDLVMTPRGAPGVRALFELRPCALRIGEDATLPIGWDAPGTDGPSYDSSSPKEEARLRLNAPLTGVLGGVLEIEPRTVVCYYLAYVRPRAGVPLTVPRQIATLVCSPSSTCTAKDARGAKIMTLAVPRSGGNARLTVFGAAKSHSYDIPGGAAGSSCVVATWSTDCLQLASLSPGRTCTRRYAAPSRCSYSASRTREVSDPPPPGTPVFIKDRVGPTSIPCLLDLSTNIARAHGGGGGGHAASLVALPALSPVRSLLAPSRSKNER
jgi:hypothetical protein